MHQYDDSVDKAGYSQIDMRGVSNNFISQYTLDDQQQYQLKARYEIKSNSFKGEEFTRKILPKYENGKYRGAQVVILRHYQPLVLIPVDDHYLQYKNKFAKFGNRNFSLYFPSKDNPTQDKIVLTHVSLKDEYSSFFSKREKESLFSQYFLLLQNMEATSVQDLVLCQTQGQELPLNWKEFIQRDIFKPRQCLLGQTCFQMYLQSPTEFQKVQEAQQNRIGDQMICFDMNVKSPLNYAIDVGESNTVDQTIIAYQKTNNEQQMRASLESCFHLLLSMDEIPLQLPKLLRDQAQDSEQDEQPMMAFRQVLTSESLPNSWCRDFELFIISDFDDPSIELKDHLVDRIKGEHKSNEHQGQPLNNDVRFYLMDFHFCHLSIKLSQIYETYFSFTGANDHMLSVLMAELHKDVNSLVSPTCMDIIRYQNFAATNHILKQAGIYIACVYIPFSILEYLKLSPLSNENENLYAVIFLLIVLALGQLHFVRLELYQVKEYENFGQYLLKDKWNIGDLLHFLVCITYIPCKIYDMRNPDDSQLFTLNVTLLMIYLIYLKLLNFMRVFDQFGFLVQMLITTVNQIATFMVFFAYALLLFTQVMIILKVDYGGNQDGDYVDVGRFPRVLLQTFRNALGDLTAPSNANWQDMGLDDTQIGIVTFNLWTSWNIAILLNQIILLNFLIAVISQAYDQVIANQLECSHQFKSDFNLEYNQYRKNKEGNLVDFQAIVFAIDIKTSYEMPEDVSLGIVNNVKRNFEKQVNILSEKIDSSQNQAHLHLDQKLESAKSEIKSDVQSQIDTLKQETAQIKDMLIQLNTHLGLENKAPEKAPVEDVIQEDAQAFEDSDERPFVLGKEHQLSDF